MKSGGDDDMVMMSEGRWNLGHLLGQNCKRKEFVC